MSATTYKLVPLSGEGAARLVDGWPEAGVIARRIAVEQQAEVLVFDAARRAIVYAADGSYRGASTSEFPLMVWDEDDRGWIPEYSPWRHGGWYVDNVRYPSGAVGCVSRNYPDRKWRIVCDERPGDHTYRTRDEAARAERDLVRELKSAA